jgi:hypothetical protein
MNTDTITTTTRLSGLFASVAEHLAVFADLPMSVITSMYGGGWRDGEAVTFQLDCETSLSELSRSMLAWADTLTGVTASVFRYERADGDDRMHLYVYGQLTDGTKVAVYGAADYLPALGLESGARRPLDLVQLEAWAADRAVAA